MTPDIYQQYIQLHLMIGFPHGARTGAERHEDQGFTTISAHYVEDPFDNDKKYSLDFCLDKDQEIPARGLCLRFKGAAYKEVHFINALDDLKVSMGGEYGEAINTVDSQSMTMRFNCLPNIYIPAVVGAWKDSIPEPA